MKDKKKSTEPTPEDTPQEVGTFVPLSDCTYRISLELGGVPWVLQVGTKVLRAYDVTSNVHYDIPKRKFGDTQVFSQVVTNPHYRAAVSEVLTKDLAKYIVQPA